LDWRAYGPEVPDERSARRTERHARTAIEAGWIRVMPWRTVNREGEWRSLPGLKFVTDKLWRLLGLYDQLKAARKYRDRQRAQDRVRQLTGQVAVPSQAPLPSRPTTIARTSTHAEVRPPPRQVGSQAVSEVGLAEIAKIKKLLGG
jgi:hypothetical protein